MSRTSNIAGQPVVIGAGIAGLMVALALAPEPVIVISKSALGADAATGVAQGGIAASLADGDDIELHVADTIAAGAGLCNEDVVRRIVSNAPAAIEALVELGVAFDRKPDGTFALGLEAAHSRRRIVHVRGDQTGSEILRALVAAARATPSITVLEGTEARHIAVEDGTVAGVTVVGPSGSLLIPTARVVITTGGIGGLFTNTTNPLGSFGHGLALAARAGAELADLEFVQFHPTALDCGVTPMPLVSEAVRGEGAILVNETGCRFMQAVPGQELAPRDVVARAAWRQLADGHRVFLDSRTTLGSSFAHHFPTIAAKYAEAGIDPAAQPIPVRPAAHYHMGGIAVDVEGHSNIRGLWACGECASTGFHGANRLASNSLLEAAVLAPIVANSVRTAPTRRIPSRAMSATDWPAPDAAVVRPIMSQAAGIIRDEVSLRNAIQTLLPLALSRGPASDPALVGLMITVASWQRRESRGAHYRQDFPAAAADRGRRSTMTLSSALEVAHELLRPANFTRRRA
jgi:L-aspartate oxidase